MYCENVVFYKKIWYSIDIFVEESVDLNNGDRNPPIYRYMYLKNKIFCQKCRKHFKIWIQIFFLFQIWNAINIIRLFWTWKYKNIVNYAAINIGGGVPSRWNKQNWRWRWVLIETLCAVCTLSPFHYFQSKPFPHNYLTWPDILSVHRLINLDWQES